MASSAFTLFPLPSFFSSLLRASKAYRTRLNSIFTNIATILQQAFKCRFKLQISPLRLEGSKSLPSFLVTNTINSVI